MNGIAVLGGAFDPPHNAHIELAMAALSQYDYEYIVILPSASPPHKRAVGSTDHRMAMAKLAFTGDKFRYSELELSNGRGYTVEILPILREHLGREFDFIIGGDSMRDFHKWYRYTDILKQVRLVVAIRNRDTDAVNKAIMDLAELPKVGIEVLQYNPTPLSSTDARLMRQLGLDISKIVPSQIKKYIEDNRLYSEYDEIRERLKSSINIDRYNHSINTAKFAMTLSANLGLDYNQVFLAALLHDCGKGKFDSTEFDIPQDSLDTAVAHAFIGAEIAKRDYNIKDRDILNAIYYHTTARADMTTLDKLIYMSDMLEESRTFEGIERLRAMAAVDFHGAFRECLNVTYQHLITNNKEIYPLSTIAYQYYKK